MIFLAAVHTIVVECPRSRGSLGAVPRRHSFRGVKANQLFQDPLHSVESRIDQIFACRYRAIWELLTDACRSPSSAVIAVGVGVGAEDAANLAPLAFPAAPCALADLSPFRL